MFIIFEKGIFEIFQCFICSFNLDNLQLGIKSQLNEEYIIFAS
jgi:hypothetical protein